MRSGVNPHEDVFSVRTRKGVLVRYRQQPLLRVDPGFVVAFQYRAGSDKAKEREFDPLATGGCMKHGPVPPLHRHRDDGLGPPMGESSCVEHAFR